MLASNGAICDTLSVKAFYPYPKCATQPHVNIYIVEFSTRTNVVNLINPLKLLYRGTVVLLLLSIMSGCGFKLRGGQPLPLGVTQLSVSSTVDHGPLHRALKKQIDLYQIPLVEQISTAEKDKTIEELKERIQVLERIVTEPSYELNRKINNL